MDNKHIYMYVKDRHDKNLKQTLQFFGRNLRKNTLTDILLSAKK